MTTDTVTHKTATHLRAIAAWLDSHPEFDVDQINFNASPVEVSDFGINSGEEMAEKARAIGGRWEKQPGDELFSLQREITPGVVARLVGWRDQVCTRVVTGTREVEISEPDHAAVEALPKITRTETVEDIEWRCAPLLAEREI